MRKLQIIFFYYFRTLMLSLDRNSNVLKKTLNFLPKEIKSHIGHSSTAEIKQIKSDLLTTYSAFGIAGIWGILSCKIAGKFLVEFTRDCQHQPGIVQGNYCVKGSWEGWKGWEWCRFLSSWQDSTASQNKSGPSLPQMPSFGVIFYFKQNTQTKENSVSFTIVHMNQKYPL